MPRIGLIAFLAVLSFAVTLAMKRHAIGELRVGAPAGEPAAATPVNATGAAPETRQGAPIAAAALNEVPDATDTTGLLEESLGIDELLDIVDADSADGFAPINRKQLAAQLESDPALREALGD